MIWVGNKIIIIACKCMLSARSWLISFAIWPKVIMLYFLGLLLCLFIAGLNMFASNSQVNLLFMIADTSYYVRLC